MLIYKQLILSNLLLIIIAAQRASSQSQVVNETVANIQDKLAGTNKLEFQYLILQKSCVHTYNSMGLRSVPIRCLAYTISQTFNLILLPLCVSLRVPQILKIIENKSVYGLSYFGNNLQLIMTGLTLAYGLYANFSFWIYGQNILLSMQNMIIIYLFFHYPEGENSRQRHNYQVSLIGPFILTLIISSLFVLQLVPDELQQISIWLQLLVWQSSGLEVRKL